jgi:hypothetical protein
MRLLNKVLFTGLCLTASLAAENMLQNEGFEKGMSSWGPWIPAESVAHAPVIEIAKQGAHTGTSAVRLSSTTNSRFAVGSYPSIPVAVAGKYRISAWYRSEAGAVVQAGLPGFVMRLNFKQDDAPPGTPNKHLYVGPSGAVSKGIGPKLTVPTLPTEWTKIEVVVEVPAQSSSMFVTFFSWGMTGALLVDDVLVEKVTDDVAPNALVGQN